MQRLPLRDRGDVQEKSDIGSRAGRAARRSSRHVAFGRWSLIAAACFDERGFRVEAERDSGSDPPELEAAVADARRELRELDEGRRELDERRRTRVADHAGTGRLGEGEASYERQVENRGTSGRGSLISSPSRGG